MKKNIIFFVSLVSAVARAEDGCTKIDPSVAMRLTDFMTVAEVDSVIGCAGVQGKSSLGMDGSVWTAKTYSDADYTLSTLEEKEVNVVFATFKNGLLKSAASTVGKVGQKGGTVAVKVTGAPPESVYCQNMVCTP